VNESDEVRVFADGVEVGVALGLSPVRRADSDGGAERFQRANETAEQDAVFTLDSLVIRHGRLSSLDTLKSGGRRSSNQAEAIEELLDAACRARVDQPASGSSNSGMVRLVARETVRASKLPAIDLQLPAGKKRADTGSAGPGLRT
jgi:hypothetical protein